MKKAENEKKLHALSDEELANVTGGLLGAYADVSLQVTGEYKCCYCGKSFSTKKECETHEDACPKNPALNSALIR